MIKTNKFLFLLTFILICFSLSAQTIVYDDSDGPFSILAQMVIVTSPNGGENWNGSETHDITWSLDSSITTVTIDYSLNGGTSWTLVASNVVNIGSHTWTVPDTPSLHCLVRVSDAGNAANHDVSDMEFYISASSLENVTAPSLPVGPNFALKNADCSFTTGNSISSLEHAVQYMFDWGDGSDSGWLAFGTNSAVHSWAGNGVYQVMARARCVAHVSVESSWSEAIALSISEDSLPVLLWNTFLGNAVLNEGYAIAADSSGNIYITGKSSSTWGSPLYPFAGIEDAFVAKFTANGLLQWHTFLGGAGMDRGVGIILDSSGNIIITGTSYASWGSPVRAFTTQGGNPDAFVAKLNAAGARQWHTFLGRSEWDYGVGVTVDGSDNILMTGYGSSSWGTPIVYHDSATNHDGFLVKLNASGTLQWLTFFGASGSDRSTGIALDNGVNILVSGYSYASWGSPLNPFAGGETDAFLVKFTAAGVRSWSTFLGGGNFDRANAIALDSNGNIFTTGYSAATWGSPLNAFVSGNDGFLAKLNATGQLQWNTFFGGSGADSSSGIVLDDTDCAMVTGSSDANWGSPLGTFSGGNDSFVVRFSLNGGVQWNTFSGGAGNDFGSGIVRDSSGKVAVTGKSDSTWGNPINPYNGNFDVVVYKMGFTANNLAVISPNGSENWLIGSIQDITWSAPASILNVNIDYLVEGGSDWISVVMNTANDGGFAWTIPATPSAACLLRISDAVNAGTSDVSDGVFSITSSTAESVSAPTQPAGEVAGENNTSYNFSSGGSISSLGHDVQYKFDWDDGSDSGWLTVGTSSADHSWAAGGTYHVRAIARCATHPSVESIWSEIHDISISENTPLLQWNTFLGNTVINEGYAIATDSSGNIYVTGKSGSTWGSPLNPFKGGEDAFVAKLNANGILQWHTFLGGNNNDLGNSITVDSGGNIVVAGTSYSTWGSPLRTFSTNGGNPDGFLAKFNANGTRLWHTFFGGVSWDYATGISVDGSSNIFVAGFGYSTWGSPINPHSGVSTHDGFLVKLSAAGAIQWNTFFGSNGGSDRVTGIKVDSNGNVAISGYSYASWGSPLNPYSGGETDAYVARFNTDGIRWWHTFLGGAGFDRASAIALDSSGNIFTTGYSASTWGGPLNAYNSGNDGFLAKLDVDGALQWNTFFGGSGADSSTCIVIDSNGCAEIAGLSDSTWGSPLAPHNGGNDICLVKFDAGGGRQWNSFFGGSGDDSGSGIVMDGNGSVMITGRSNATWGSPINPFSGNYDILIAKFGFE